jgi:CHAT domain-containing protein
MAAKCRRAKRRATGILGRQAFQVCSCFLFFISCARSPDKVFGSARAEAIHGRFSQAREYASDGYTRFRNQPASQWHWKFKLLLAEMHLYNFDTREAEALLAIPPPPQYPRLAPRYQELRGYVLLLRQQYVAGERLLRATLVAAHTLGDYEVEADTQLLLAAFLKDRVKGEAASRSALSIANAHGLEYQRSAALLNLGMTFVKRAHYGDAIPYFEEASRIASRIGAVLLNSSAIGNTATCFYYLGDYPRALRSRLDAMALQRGAGLATPLKNSYLELGDIYLDQGENVKALGYFRQALGLVNKRDSPAQFAAVASAVAQALEESGSLDEAEHYNRQAFDACSKDDREQLAYAFLTRALIANRRGRLPEATQAYREALAAGTKVPAVQWQAYGGLGGLYARSGDLSRAKQSYESALRVIGANRADQLHNEYKITFLSNLMGFYQDYVELLIEQHDLRQALEIADSSRAGVLTENLADGSGTTITQLEHDLKSASATVLFYWLAPKHSYLWILSPAAFELITLPDKQQLDREIASYSALIQQEKRDPAASASAVGLRLYDKLIRPAAPYIGHGSQVVLIPDGSLHSLNFETLLVPSPAPHYWIEDVTVSVAPSLGSLQVGRATSLRPRSLLLMGDPVMAGTGFDPLPDAANEMQQIRRHFPAAQTTVFTQASAVPDAYRSAQPRRFSTIHFVTHADANKQSPLDSAIILSPHANRFRLYARDVAEIPLDADLVTISACRGAGARTLSGEGLVGFAWAFFEAGARNVVTSLWDVNDRSTASFMGYFYAGVDSGLSYPAALRNAKLKLLQSQYRKPYYWAPFQLYSRTISATPLKTKLPEIPDTASVRRKRTASAQ